MQTVAFTTDTRVMGTRVSPDVEERALYWAYRTRQTRSKLLAESLRFYLAHLEKTESENDDTQNNV